MLRISPLMVVRLSWLVADNWLPMFLMSFKAVRLRFPPLEEIVATGDEVLVLLLLLLLLLVPMVLLIIDPLIAVRFKSPADVILALRLEMFWLAIELRLPCLNNQICKQAKN